MNFWSFIFSKLFFFLVFCTWTLWVLQVITYIITVTIFIFIRIDWWTDEELIWVCRNKRWFLIKLLNFRLLISFDEFYCITEFHNPFHLLFFLWISMMFLDELILNAKWYLIECNKTHRAGGFNKQFTKMFFSFLLSVWSYKSDKFNVMMAFNICLHVTLPSKMMSEQWC